MSSVRIPQTPERKRHSRVSGRRLNECLSGGEGGMDSNRLGPILGAPPRPAGV